MIAHVIVDATDKQLGDIEEVPMDGAEGRFTVKADGRVVGWKDHNGTYVSLVGYTLISDDGSMIVKGTE